MSGSHPVQYLQGHNKPWYHSREPMIIRDPEAFPPNSNYWKGLALGAMELLADIIGDDLYREFAELAWPGASIDDLTWMQIHDQASAAYRLAKWDGERDIHKLAEAARNATG